LEAFRTRWQQAEKPAHWRLLYVITDEVFGRLEADEPPFCETTSYDS
jgi:dTDP-glucose 4,6-dehydratase